MPGMVLQPYEISHAARTSSVKLVRLLKPQPSLFYSGWSWRGDRGVVAGASYVDFQHVWHQATRRDRLEGEHYAEEPVTPDLQRDDLGRWIATLAYDDGCVRSEANWWPRRDWWRNNNGRRVSPLRLPPFAARLWFHIEDQTIHQAEKATPFLLDTGFEQAISDPRPIQDAWAEQWNAQHPEYHWLANPWVIVSTCKVTRGQVWFNPNT